MLIVAHLVYKILFHCGTWTFTLMSTRGRRWYLSWAHEFSPQPRTLFHQHPFNISHLWLCLQSGNFSSEIQLKFCTMYFPSLIYILHARSISKSLILSFKQLATCTNHELPHYAVLYSASSDLTGSNIFLRIFFPSTLNKCCTLTLVPKTWFHVYITLVKIIILYITIFRF